MNMSRSLILCIALSVFWAPMGSASASHSNSAPDAGVAFEVPPLREAIYEVQAPQTDPDTQRAYVTASDGVQIWVETWLPKDPSTGETLADIPTVVTYSAYAKKGSPPNSHFSYMNELVTRGYAFTTVHVRGTGESGGCLDMFGKLELGDGELALRHIAEAPWSNGELGMIGLSYPGNTAVNLAANGSDGTRQLLKAIVVGAPGNIMNGNYDGVLTTVSGGTTPVMAPYGYIPYSTPADAISYAEPPERVVMTRIEEGGLSPIEYWADRPGCHTNHLAQDADTRGDVTSYMQDREIRRGAPSITTPTFMFHGFEDFLRPATQAGLFEQISAPKTGLFGHWWHETPDDHYSGIEPAWERVDFKALAIGWLDHYLMGIDNGADGWPVAQVQDNSGQWRAEGDWPTTGGPVGHLVLGDGAMLGDDQPSGTSTYRETVTPFDRDFALRDVAPSVDGKRDVVTFTTEPLDGPLHITGQPLLDLWIELHKPEGGGSSVPADAHIAAELISYDATGEEVPLSANFGARSMRHLEPLSNNLFMQAVGVEPLVDAPIRVPIRMAAVDYVVPAGGWLELRISGAGRAEAGLEPAGAPTVFQHPTRTSNRAMDVTILHDCEYTSALRFLMPQKNATLINVREEDEADTVLRDGKERLTQPVDADGLATHRVCGKGPTRAPELSPTLGEEFHYRWK